MHLTGGDYVIIGLWGLEDLPHGLDVVAGEAPVAFGVQVTQVDGVLEAEFDARDGAGSLSGYDPSPGTHSMSFARPFATRLVP